MVHADALITPFMHLVSISRLLVTAGKGGVNVLCIEFLKPV